MLKENFEKYQKLQQEFIEECYRLIQRYGKINEEMLGKAYRFPHDLRINDLYVGGDYLYFLSPSYGLRETIPIDWLCDPNWEDKAREKIQKEIDRIALIEQENMENLIEREKKHLLELMEKYPEITTKKKES